MTYNKARTNRGLYYLGHFGTKTYIHATIARYIELVSPECGLIFQMNMMYNATENIRTTSLVDALEK